MGPAFKKIALMARGRKKGVEETLSAVAQYLTEAEYEVFIEAETAKIFKDIDLTPLQATELDNRCELLVVIGGDGSIIKAAHLAAPHKLPILGINRGRLGFLTDIHPYEFEQLERVLHGEYVREDRFMLKCELFDDGKLLYSDKVVNEIALSRGLVTHMVDFDVYINHQFMCHYRADGLITATPTGSTAYAMSGGGPILHPRLDAMVMVPMFPHTLTSRPIVIPADSCIEFIIDEKNESGPCISCDGQERVCIKPGGRMKIEKADTVLRLIHPKDYNYYETLRTKLHWESVGAR